MPGGLLPRRRRQWVLLPSGTGYPGQWQRIEVAGGYVIAHDPDLPVSRAATATSSATMLGFAIDPRHPDAATETILHTILSSDKPIRDAQDLAGRWVLLLRCGGRSVMLHDACGLRQVVWTTEPGGVSCASDPSLLAEIWGFERDIDANARYVESGRYRRWREQWWPGTTTPYAEIRQLLPNHLLDLDTGNTERYWPVDRVATRATEDAARQGADLLESLVACAVRFPTALPVTAGWDSRLLLAATEATRMDCWHYTLAHDGLFGNAQDLVVAGELMRKLGKDHHVVRCPDRTSQAFGAVYRDSVTSSHELWGEMVEALWRDYPADHICLRGNGNEIARTYHRWHGDDKVAPADLAVCHGARGNEFVIEHLAEWQHEAEPVAERAGIHLLDLFYWEQKMGRWQAEYQLEFDLAQETYTPYNHRPLLALLLGTPEHDRRAPGYELHRKMIGHMNPALLDVPVNPQPWRSRARARLDHLARDGARRVGLYRRLRGTNA